MSEADRLQVLIAPVVESFGLMLWGIEVLGSAHHGILRVYIEKDEGITLDDCEMVSRQLSAVLDVEDPIARAYTLEVSSPGIERPLFTREQYLGYVGERIKVRCHEPMVGRQNIVGELLKVHELAIVIGVENTEITIEFTNIARAKLV